jgi:hypothetical protein
VGQSGINDYTLSQLFAKKKNILVPRYIQIQITFKFWSLKTRNAAEQNRYDRPYAFQTQNVEVEVSMETENL